MSETIRVLLVDDHGVVRRGLGALLATYDDIEVVGDAGSGAEGWRSACCPTWYSWTS